MSEGTKITASGLLLLAAALIGLYGMYVALQGWNLVYPLLFCSAGVASLIVPVRRQLSHQSLYLILSLLAFLFGILLFDRIWAPMDPGDRLLVAIGVLASVTLAVGARWVWWLMQRSIAHRAAKRIVT